jgi:hypothetical protein
MDRKRIQEHPRKPLNNSQLSSKKTRRLERTAIQLRAG